MRFVSWNVNGLRACMQKGFMDYFNTVNADFFCLQETKLQEGQIDLDLPGYEQYWCYAEKKGYSGTAIFTKHTPLSVAYGMGIAELDTEGRLITLEYPEFYLVTCYTPNAQRGLARIEHRLKWEAAFRDYLTDLDSKKPVILCGDLNVAHKEIDLKNPASNRGNAGFSDEERDAFTKLLERGFTDSFRHLHPDATGAYTWWSYMFNARQNNAGWRIDYFVVSERIKEQLYATPIYSDILGSDHCPVGLDLDISCNGSIWPSFENTDAAPKTEETNDAKSSGVKAAAMLLCAALLLTVLFFAVPKDTPDTPQPSTAPSLNSGYDDLIAWSILPCEVSHTYGGNIFSSVIEITSVQYSTKNYPVAPTYLSGSENFWIRVAAREQSRLLNSELTATLTDGANAECGHEQSRAFCKVVQYYDDQGAFAGWFVYGYIEADSYINLSVVRSNRTLQSVVFPISPIISAEKAAIMSTEQLAQYAVHLETMDMLMELSTAAYQQTWFMEIWQSYPALLELTFREDAEKVLLAHGAQYPACEQTANTLCWLINSAVARLEPYRSASTEIFNALSTQSLANKLMENPALLTYLDDMGSVLSNDLTVFRVLQNLQPAAAYLDSREDAAGILLECYESSPMAGFLLKQPDILSTLTLAQAGTYLDKLSKGKGLAALETDTLVEVITCLVDVRTSLLYGTYSAQYLSDYFPAMQELEKRSDAIISLIAMAQYGSMRSMEDQAKTASLLLASEPYFSNMTEAEKIFLEKEPTLYGNGTVLPLPPDVVP